MTATAAFVLAICWPCLVLALAWRWRPAPVRLGRLAFQPASSPRAGPIQRLVRPVAHATELLGTFLLNLVGGQIRPERSRRVGITAAAALVFAPVSLGFALLAAGTAWMIPRALASRSERRHMAAVAADLPEVVDLISLAVGAGLTVAMAVRQVGRRGTGPLAAELARVSGEVALGRRLADSLEDLPRQSRAGEAVRGLVVALVASERYGAPLAPALDRLSAEVRADRRRRAEEAGRKVPVKLLFPLVTCTLPAFALLTVAPLIASAVRSLRL